MRRALKWAGILLLVLILLPVVVVGGDGAAAVLLMRVDKARELGLPVLARIVSSAVAGVDPSVMGIGPVPATAAAIVRSLAPTRTISGPDGSTRTISPSRSNSHGAVRLPLGNRPSRHAWARRSRGWSGRPRRSR